MKQIGSTMNLPASSPASVELCAIAPLFIDCRYDTERDVWQASWDLVLGPRHWVESTAADRAVGRLINKIQSPILQKWPWQPLLLVRNTIARSGNDYRYRVWPVRLHLSEDCADCKGSGRYEGFNVVAEDCRRCNGAGWLLPAEWLKGQGV